MKKIYLYFVMGCMLLAACGNEKVEAPQAKPETPEDENVDDDLSSVLTGYAAPGGVLILSGGSYELENAFLTFISPESEVENKVYAQANASELGNDGVGLYLCGGKQYILSNDWRKVEGKESNGLLIIADAETLQKEKSFPRADMTFQHPVNDKQEEVDASLSGIAVLDEQNIFIFAQGVLRFDSTTGKLKLIEGAYDIGNAGSANTVESIVSSRGATVYNDCLYAATGGFWSTTALLEFTKGKDEVNRRLELGRGDLVSGMCLTPDSTLIVATYTRGRDSGYLSFVDLDTWTVTDRKNIAANISPALHNNSGITYLNGYLYVWGETQNLIETEETLLEPTLVSNTVRYRSVHYNGRIFYTVCEFDEPIEYVGITCEDKQQTHLSVSRDKFIYQGDKYIGSNTLAGKVSSIDSYFYSSYSNSYQTKDFVYIGIENGKIDAYISENGYDRFFKQVTK